MECFDKDESIIENTAIQIKNCQMSKLNGILFFRIIFSWSYIYREKIFIATRDLYREMGNLEKKFQNNLK